MNPQAMDDTGTDPGIVMSRQDVLNEMWAFRQISTQFAESASELVAISMRIQMLAMEDMRAGLGEVADIVSGSIRNRRDHKMTED